MSSAGRAASSSGCVARPRGRETGLTGYAEQIQRSLPTGSSAMETAEHREPYESRGSRTDLGAPGGESPPGDSTMRAVSDEMVLTLSAAGTADDVPARVSALLKAGLKQAVLFPLAVDGDASGAILRTIEALS